MTSWIVVGLGNPGPTYSRHWHNVGHWVVDDLARRGAASWSAARLQRADTATVRLGRDGVAALGDVARLVLVKSRTYMNESGAAVGRLLAYHKVGPDHLVVVHDELDLDLGQIRLKLGGGDNGHNGLRSIRSVLGTGDFHRVRVGIGRPPGRMQAADYVLSNVPAALADQVALEVGRAADAVEVLVGQGLTAAQNLFNS